MPNDASADIANAATTVETSDPLTALDNRRTMRMSPLLSPALLRAEHPIDPGIAKTVTLGRRDTVDILDGRDDRLLVVVGPCSVHDPAAALHYARLLSEHAQRVSDALCIVMRVYFEKPRTTLGWKGLINDPDLDGTYAVNKGLRLARQLLLDISTLGLPVGCEFLDPITPQYIADTVTWGSIGARTAASQVHRQLCSALSMPVGIKNHPPGRLVGAELRRRDGVRHLVPTAQGWAARAGDHRCEPRQQPQGPRAPSGRGARARRADSHGRARHRRAHDGELPRRGTAGSRARSP